MNGLINSDDADKATDDMMDDDSDGKISLEEYIKACMDREEFTRMLTLKIIDIFVETEEDQPEEEAQVD